MSPPPSPSPERASLAETFRALRRTTAVQVWSGMVAWRWVLVGMVFAVSALMAYEGLGNHFEYAEIRRPVDAWDIFPGLVTTFWLVFWVLGFGFPLFVVDTYQRGREQGILTMAVARVPSRSIYWLATMGAVGVMALGYAGACFLVSLLVGMLLCPPASAWPMLPREGLPSMYPRWDMSVPVYSIIVMLYTAYTLWITGCVAVLVSLLSRRKVVALGFIVLWVLLSMSLHYLTVVGGMLTRLLNLGYLIGIFKHHFIKEPFPMDLFFALTAAALVLMALVGSWRLRREEL
jgi:hypothetical protein